MTNLHCRIALVVSLAFGAIACGTEEETKGGSCTRPDPTAATLTLCTELENKSLPFEGECAAVGGTWSASACTTTSYARRCRQTTEVNGVARPELHFFQTGSQMSCLGDETNL